MLISIYCTTYQVASKFSGEIVPASTGERTSRKGFVLVLFDVRLDIEPLIAVGLMIKMLWCWHRSISRGDLYRPAAGKRGGWGGALRVWLDGPNILCLPSRLNKVRPLRI